jgi:sulfur carrier protein ThiS
VEKWDEEQMKITVENEKEGTICNLTTKALNVKELLIELSVNPETILVARNSEILLSCDTLKEGDKIILLSVISGG